MPSIAIVGMDCVLPGAQDAEAWIHTDDVALGAAPEGRLPPGIPIAAVPGTPDARTTDVGGFVRTDVRSALPEALDPLFHWVAHVVAGARPERFRPDRSGLVLANLSLPTTGHVRALGLALREHLGVTAPWLEGGVPEDRWHSAAPAFLAARASDLLGGASALDAACASGLYAVQVACARLASGALDLVVAAAANRADAAYLSLGFSQLRALSPSGSSRPLDRSADGLLVGEGAAAVALKRLEDALADGDRIQGIIRGVGLGNDGKGGVLAPEPAGQLRALRAAWGRAGADPETVGYVECHATGTPVGDRTELEALGALLGQEGPPVAVASSKALIGHTVTCAGLAGLLRAVGAVRDGFLPPAVACGDPIEALGGRLVAHAERAPWPEDRPRRAGVSAFGFGGTNAHLVLDGPSEASQPAPPPAPVPRLAIVGAAAQLGMRRGGELLADLRSRRSRLRDAPPVVARGLHTGSVGTWVEEVRVDPRRFRIPPVELADLLPQQLIALDVAADAIAGAPRIDPARTACIVGMEVDPHVAEPIARLALLQAAPEVAAALGGPLTAPRVQGSLPNLVANRISGQLGLQGPSYTVSAGAGSAAEALEQAALLLRDGPDLDAVLVACVDLPGHPTPAPEGPRAEGAIAFVVRRLAEASERGDPIRAVVHGASSGADPASAARRAYRVVAPERVYASDWHAWLGHGEALDGALGILLACARADGPAAVLTREPEAPATAVVVEPVSFSLDEEPGWDRVLAVPHSGPPLGAPPTWTTAALPSPRPLWGRPTEGIDLCADPPSARPLAWIGATSKAPPPPLPVRGDATAGALQAGALARQVAAGMERLAATHGRFLAERARAQEELARFAQRISIHPTPVPGAAPPPPQPAPVPTAFDRAALERHATGKLSDVFGPTYADLDAYEPRVRLPAPPLLLVSRVLELEGTRGSTGPARILTEYDLPLEAEWAGDGAAPPCVVVESGQADLLLVSWLGIDATCRGERVYRLLDCDLTFHGPRPVAGETLRHDIRIEHFTQLGATTLFTFRYDCTSDGRPVLSMREGCAGFFTPEELRSPRGLRPPPVDATPQAPQPVALSGVPERWSEAQVQAVAEGRFSDAFGPALAPADGSSLRLPRSRWRLVHRVQSLMRRGGPCGLGSVVFEQDLRDDDWFNPCHFVGDPCMPGTLMYDGCHQAVQVWLLGHGLSAAFPDGSFEPIEGCTTRLRCRGQVVPGQSLLTYRATIKRAGLDPRPWAIADVTLEVDGTPVVSAVDVGVRVAGERIEPRSGIDARRVLEFSVGSAVAAFGPAYKDFDAGSGRRCARMPGPPYLTMTRVEDVQGAPGAIVAPASTTIAYDLPADAWFFAASPGDSLCFAVLLEIALQPCGWLTAWQHAGIVGGADLYFRNLGGTATQHVEVWPDAGTLTTRVTQTSVSASGGLQVQFFDCEVRAGDVLVFSCTTHFGYFTASALDGQKGLQPDAELETRRRAWTAGGAIAPRALAGHPALPRDDLRMLDELVAADPTGGPAGLGWYAARKHVDPGEWFFTAHFFCDPVMPGSLGLEALLQLARVVLIDRLGLEGGRLVPLVLGEPTTWRYRGQVRRPNRVMEVELEVLAVDEGARPILRGAGTVRADGLPIYRFDDFAVQWVEDAAPEQIAAVPTRTPVAPLLDRFDIDSGTGALLLDPAVHPWLDHHRPTLAAPALPLAFALEIAAEAALLLRPDLRVIGIPSATAERWVHCPDGPVELLVAATVQGEVVDIELAVYEENTRFPKLSGPQTRMRVRVQLGSAFTEPVEAPELDAPEPPWSARELYDGGHTFHGPVLQGLKELHALGPRGAVATLQAAPDAAVLGADLAFSLDPALLDAATQPMCSGSPELWSDAIEPGTLAYPVSVDDLRLFGPRPLGPIRCTLALERADSELVFAVHLAGPDGPWCAYRWTEAVVDAGPVLGHPAPVRRAFLWDREPHPDVVVGRPTERGWVVEAGDLVEPMPGTLSALLCTPAEREEDGSHSLVPRLAAKHAVLAHLRAEGHPVHPSALELVRLRPDRFVVRRAATLTAAELVQHVGPTRLHVRVAGDETRSEAWLEAAPHPDG